MVNNHQKPSPDVSRAVAVQRNSEDEAPRITATGHGALADKIVDAAFEHGVKVRKDSDLAELLESFDVDSPVPLEALHAVGEILDYVYRLNGRMIEDQEKANPFDVESELIDERYSAKPTEDPDEL